eukprot:g35981.t1
MTEKPVDPELKVGRCFQSINDNARGRIHYIGTVHTSKRPRAVYLGIEWFEQGRGKHDGMVDGRCYYSCPDKHGAFIHPGSVQLDRSFLEAVKDKYAPQVKEKEDLYMRSVNIEGKETSLKVDFV